MYRRQLAACNYSTKGYKKTRYDTVTADDLDISTWAIYFACWPMNRIGGGQHGAVSIALHHFVWLNFPCAQHEANNTQLILSSMNNCNFIAVRCCTHADAQELLCIAWNKMSRNFPLLVNTKRYSLFQITHNMSPMEVDASYQGCLPSCELHSRSPTVRCYRQSSQFVDCMLHNVEIGWFSIQMLEKHKNALFWLEIPPHSVYICMYVGGHWRHSHNKMDQVSPLHVHVYILHSVSNGKDWERSYADS